jgi:hypothetical protein
MNYSSDVAFTSAVKAVQLEAQVARLRTGITLNPSTPR